MTLYFVIENNKAYYYTYIPIYMGITISLKNGYTQFKMPLFDHIKIIKIDLKYIRIGLENLIVLINN